MPDRGKWFRRTLCSLALLVSALAGAAQDCLDCHLASADQPVLAIQHSAHAALAGGGNEACRACHGDSAGHIAAPASSAPDFSFGPHWPMPAAEGGARCLTCHAGGEQLHWAGSAHAAADLACTDCHSLHRQSQLAPAPDPATSGCLTCHSEVRAELRLPSRHPIAEGKTACTDCHNPHGSPTPGELAAVTLNDTCFTCHSEKRGPFLWEHPPASEDCSLCHRPHGSVHPRLLTARGPALCQQCHAAAFHPSLPYGGEGVAGAAPNQNLLGKNCLNCHGQVHGSNHPSGARLTR
ncbi:DmsE family decaheme c-type cytochrome [Haliea sp. E17]|uniref:DmsE family decaheme c-type cytochrome n=1 Tax=Haliea sp. E17 TaxID=3401576 RepID=UPI003AAB4060